VAKKFELLQHVVDQYIKEQNRTKITPLAYHSISNLQSLAAFTGLRSGLHIWFPRAENGVTGQHPLATTKLKNDTGLIKVG
jgi:hypothetical protein